MPSDSNTQKTHQTGQSLRTNQSSLYNRLSQITKYYSKALKQIIDMSLRVRKIDPVKAKVSVQWETNFSFQAFIDSIEELALLKATVTDMAPTIVKEYCKKVINPKLFDSGKMDQIDAQIDSWVPAPTAPPADGTNLQKLNTEIAATSKVADAESSGN